MLHKLAHSVARALGLILGEQGLGLGLLRGQRQLLTQFLQPRRLRYSLAEGHALGALRPVLILRVDGRFLTLFLLLLQLFHLVFAADRGLAQFGDFLD